MSKEKLIKPLEIVVSLKNKDQVENNSENGKIKIVILQRGWVAIGRFYREGNDCTLKDAYWIRRWGTDKGLGQLAIKGKQSNTILDKTGTIHFDYLTVVALINCEERLWKNEL
jgi:hypothetical protein